MKDDYLYIISKYLAGELADSEREALFEWINRSEANKSAFNEMQELWEMSAEADEAFESDVNMAWKRVAARTIEKQAKVIRHPWRRQLLRFAAVLLIGVMAAFWWFNRSPEMIHLEALAGEKTSVELPDGSKVWLNANTQISYEADFEPRLITLEGEAFFEVAHQHGKSFVIKSGKTRTVVLGTSFNVRAYPEEKQVEVTVKTGKVAFESETGKAAKVLLTAGDSGVFDKKVKRMDKQEQKISNADSWKTGEIIFENTQIDEVEKVLERYFAIDISTANANILNCHFDGNYKKPDLDVILEALSFSLHLEIDKQANRIVLKGKGCE